MENYREEFLKILHDKTFEIFLEIPEKDSKSKLIIKHIKHHNFIYPIQLKTKLTELKDSLTYNKISSKDDITYLISILNNLKNEFQTIEISTQSYRLQRDVIVLEQNYNKPGEDDIELSIEELNNDLLEEIHTLCSIKESILIDTLDYLNTLYPDFSQTRSTKLKTSLSVGDLALLFRILYDEGVILADNKTDLYNFASNHFSSKKQEDVSVNSFKNKFLTPDIKSIDEFNILLRKLRASLDDLVK